MRLNALVNRDCRRHELPSLHARCRNDLWMRRAGQSSPYPSGDRWQQTMLSSLLKKDDARKHLFELLNRAGELPLHPVVMERVGGIVERLVAKCLTTF